MLQTHFANGGLLGSELTGAGVATYLIQKAKNSAWLGFVNTQTAPIFSCLAALGAAIGIHATYDGATSTLMITGLSLSGVLYLGWHWLTQWVMQEAAYQTTISKAIPNTPAAQAPQAAAGK